MMDQKKNDELFDCFLTQALNDCAREEWKAAAEDSSEVKLSEKTEKAMQKLLREQKYRRFADRFARKKQTYMRIASAVAAALILVISSTVAPYRAQAEGNYDFYAYNDQKKEINIRRNYSFPRDYQAIGLRADYLPEGYHFSWSQIYSGTHVSNCYRSSTSSQEIRITIDDGKHDILPFHRTILNYDEIRSLDIAGARDTLYIRDKNQNGISHLVWEWYQYRFIISAGADVSTEEIAKIAESLVIIPYHYDQAPTSDNS